MPNRENQPTSQPSPPQAAAARAAAAQQIKLSEEAAKEVADLCAQAADAAKQHRVPHAGVGGSEASQT